MVAARYGHSEIVDLLLSDGRADLNLTDGLGRTSLMLATMSGNERSVDLLQSSLASISLSTLPLKFALLDLPTAAW